MHRTLLATAICAVLAAPVAPAVFAQDSAPPPQTETGAQPQPSPPAEEQAPAAQATSQAATPATELEKVTVTGSRIPRSQVETASPVLTITSEDIQKQGFRNVSDVLRAQPLSTGAVQDNQFAGGFTANATTISLLGLSPSFTLILLDGRPLADYPLLYNGQSNFVDLTSIPTAMVDRIDILPGNQSSIYGSAAIAGVVNIILKKHIDGVQLDLRVGGYTEGGGSNERVQVTGGNTWDKLDLVWGLQVGQQDPIYMRQRDFTDTTDDNPNPDLRYGSRTFIILNGFTGTYDDPGDHCDDLSFLFGGSTIKDFRPGRGDFCGSRAQPGYATLLNEEKGLSGYLNATYALNDTTSLYATLLAGKNKAQNDAGSHFWVPDINGTHNNYIWNSNENTLETYQHIFAPEEQGSDNFYDTDSISYSFAFGIKGAFGSSNWDYDAYYSRSGFKVTSDQLWPLVAPMEDFFRQQFLGPQLGTYYGYPVYAPDKDAFYQAVTPEQYHAFSGNIHNESTTWTQTLNFQVVNANLFQMPAGSVGMAAVLQAGNQSWDNPIDPRITNNEFFGLNGTSGNGKRNNQALGVEFTIPLLKELTADVALRYDAYQNVDAGSDSKPTYKVGLEFRPIDTLLFRANYATAFRAPDMGYIFTGGNGFFTSETDFYKCEIDPGNCNLYTGLSVEGNQVANPDLKSINAHSYGFGFVWAPSSALDLHADYYNVAIEDEVVPQSTTQTLFDENECRQGRLDPTSARCIDALSRVIRGPVNPNNPLLSQNVQLIIVKGINIAEENVSGITAGGNFRWDAERFGKFSLGLEYNLTLDHKIKTFPDSPPTDVFTNGQLLTAEFKSVVTGDLGWQLGRWAANLHGTRYGSLPNYARQFTTDPADPYVTSNGVGPGEVGPWMLYNLSVDYSLTDNSTLSLIVNNIKDSKPPRDPSYDGSQGFAPPYYNIFAYNGYGRSYWVEYRINFGQ